MAAMKPRTGDGPLEVTKEGGGIVMRVPLEGGGRLVVEMSATEAGELGDALKAVAPASCRERHRTLSLRQYPTQGPGRSRPGPSSCPVPGLGGGRRGLEGPR